MSVRPKFAQNLGCQTKSLAFLAMRFSVGWLVVKWLVEQSDEVEDSLVISTAALDRGHNFLDVLFLALLDVVRFSEYLRRVRRYPVFAGSVGFEERNVEDIVNLPFPR